MATLPDQRVSVAKKGNAEWYKQMADYVIDLAVYCNDKTFTAQCLDAANGILSESDYAEVLKTYVAGNEATDQESRLDAAKLAGLRDVDILTPIKEKYMGEFINSYHNYQVYSLDPNVVLRRNAELGELVKKMMKEKLQAVLAQKMQEQGMQDPNATSDPNSPQQPAKQEIDINKFIREFLNEWVDETVVSEQNALELLNAVIEAKRKYIDAYFYWWACEEVYTYRRLSGKDVLFEVVSPLEYYRVDSGNYFVEDDNYGLRRYTLTIQDVIDTFYNNMDDGLSEDQVALLKRIANESQSGIGYVNPTIFLDFRRMFPDDAKTPNALPFTKQGLAVTVDHYFFKTEIKKGILTYVAPTGEVTQMDVDEDYVLNIAAGDIDIEWTWINQMWEGWRFGSEPDLLLYIKPRPVLLQRELISNTSVCKAPYNGISYIHRNSAKRPIPYRIKDYLALYKIYTLLEERWIAKFKSWLLLPESVLSNSKEFTTAERLQNADLDALLPFNDADMERNPQAVNQFREVSNTAIVNFVNTLNQIKQSIKAEAWELAHMNSARFGDGSNPYKGKGTTEYDYNQAIKGTVWSLEMFNSFRERDYQANLDYSRAAWIEGKQGSYIDDNTKEIKVVDVDGEAHLGTNVGIYIANSAELNQQAQELKQLAFSAGQNGDPVVQAEAITNKNVSKLKQLIKQAKEANEAFQLKMQTAKEEVTRQIEETRLQNDREQRAHEKELKQMDIDGNYDVALLESETDLEINAAKLEVDINGNGYISKEEADGTSREDLLAKQRGADMLNARKLALEQVKIGLAKKKADQAAKKAATKPKAK